MENSSNTSATNQTISSTIATQAVKAPPKDTRFKTDDVTSTKGLSFQDFGLDQDV
jgi:hypothetical protein